MEYGIFDFLQLIGSLGIFIYGMKVMSEGLQKLAGSGLRKILSGMTSTRLSGVITGVLITCLVQSSSATTVMVVSFVNAGLLTLGQSLGVVMGANIGTTITAWIVAALGFKVKIVPIATVLIGFFFPFLFSKNVKMKQAAEFVLGFGLLFIGLSFLKNAVPDLKHNPEILSFLNHYTNLGMGSVLIFVVVGTFLTVVVQSSSASTTITLVMLAQGWVNYEMAAAMVLGENIGTTITANIAAMAGNVHAKRSARFHFVFNIIGVIWMLIAFYPFVNGVQNLAASMNLDSKLGLALFHTSFNVLNVVLMVGFTPLLERLVIKMQPSRGEFDERFELKFIGSGLLSTPELSAEEAKKEIQLMAKLVRKMYSNLIVLLFKEPKNLEGLLDKIKKREEVTDRLEVELSTYLSKVSQADLSEQLSFRIRGMLRIVNELERIADIIYQMSMGYKRMREDKSKLPEEVKVELEKVFDKVYEFIKMMNANIENIELETAMKNVYEIENSINNLRDDMQQNHYDRLEKGAYSVKEGIVFLDYVNGSEKIGDHLVNINEALVGW